MSAMNDAEQILGQATSLLLVDWPSAEVSDTLARAGYIVYGKGGPEPDAFSIREVRDGEPVVRPLGRAPERVDVVYCHRPLSELPTIVAMAVELGAEVVWHQSGRTSDGLRDPRACWLSVEDLAYVQGLVESAGLRAVTQEYIADAARRVHG
jgi:hypothetical protein